MISMFPLKINSFLERAPVQTSSVGAMRPRLAAAESPTLAPAPAVRPEHDRRMLTDRRMQDRRASEQPAFLDTRVQQGRRRTTGRRAGDQQARLAISIQA